MSAFTPDGLPFVSPEFAAPLSPETASVNHYQLFERMMQEVEVSTVSSDAAKYLLGLAANDEKYAAHLKHQFERPGGFKGPNAL